MPRALAARDTRGLIKLVADAITRLLLGAHILAPEGADSIQTAALAIRQGLKVDDLAEMIFPYFTTVEGLKLAALGFNKDVAALARHRNLTKGEPHFTLSQVALNDTITVFAFAPIVGLLLGLSAITVPWDTLVLSVALYIVVPVVAAQLLRRRLLAAGGDQALKRFLDRLQPLSLVALLATLVLLFGFQGEQILAQPLVIALLAVPILIQVYFNAGLAYLLKRLTGEQHCVASPPALIGASNFFEQIHSVDDEEPTRRSVKNSGS